ncbi:hypothetical protein ACRRTK_012706 [Alexandromys fortis]
MKSLLNLLFLLFFVIIHSKVYKPCDFARIMKRSEMDGYRGFSLENWMCLAQHESSFNTGVVTYHRGHQSTSYGIFQINSRHWCNDGKTPKAVNACGIPCSVLLQDDITEAITCAKKVVSDLEGIRAWYPWKTHCENRDLTKYPQKCTL